MGSDVGGVVGEDGGDDVGGELGPEETTIVTWVPCGSRCPAPGTCWITWPLGASELEVTGTGT